MIFFYTFTSRVCRDREKRLKRIADEEAAAALAVVKAEEDRIRKYFTDIKDAHDNWMATYKVRKCAIKETHDRKVCLSWHTAKDKRRNPLMHPYFCLVCPENTNMASCPDADDCMHTHSELEVEFHPNNYKVSMCMKGPEGQSACSVRNVYKCSGAHSQDDLRKPGIAVAEEEASCGSISVELSVLKLSVVNSLDEFGFLKSVIENDDDEEIVLGSLQTASILNQESTQLLPGTICTKYEDDVILDGAYSFVLIFCLVNNSTGYDVPPPPDCACTHCTRTAS
jgi:hypothetical protein